MIRSTLYIFLFLLPMMSFAVKKDSLKDKKVYFSGGISAYSLIERHPVQTYYEGDFYRVGARWKNKFLLKLNFSMEWRKWRLTHGSGILTGRMIRNYIFENKDQAISQFGDIPDNQFVYSDFKCNNLYFELGVGRVFNIPKTRLRVQPKIGAALTYTIPKTSEFEYRDDYGQNAYNIDKAVVSVNQTNYKSINPFISLDITHAFSFGEIGLTCLYSGLYISQHTDFYTDRAFAFRDRHYGGWKEFLALGIIYKIYFNK